MENNYNFNINPKEPSSSDIRRHMDFDALLNQLESRPKPVVNPLRFRRMIYAIGIAAAVALLLVLSPNFFTSSPLDSNNYFARQAFINPPLPTIQTKENIEIIKDAYQGGVIQYASGSRIVVPAAAFMNDRGHEIGGEVEVHYRELNDFVDFFVHGIPMVYDSTGLQRYLSSAGMVEIYAEQNGQRLKLAPGKAIQVELVSEVIVDDYFTLPKYSVYQLDTKKRNWQYRNIDILQFIEEDQWAVDGQLTPQQQWQQQLVKLNEAYQQELADLQLQYPLPAAPFKPTKASGDRPVLELDFLNGEIALDPLSQVQQEDIERLHNGTIWQITEDSPKVDPNAFKVTWERVRLKKLNNQRYELTLIHSQNEERLIVEPVLFGADYERATNNYQLELQAYNEAVTEREQQISVSKEGLQQLFNDKKIALQLDFKSNLQNHPEQLKRQLIHRFIINEFGIWACGQAVDTQSSLSEVTFVDQDGQPFEAITAYIVNDNQNTLYRYMAEEEMSVNLQSGTPNLLWIVDNEGRISLSRIEELDAQSTTFKLLPVGNDIKTEEELRAVLQF